MLGTDFNADGYVFWGAPEKATPVLNVLNNSASTSEPSHFTLTATTQLEPVCKAAAARAPSAPQTKFNIEDVTGAVQNWYHALCAPSTDTSWNGAYDPAYQPQQIALTAGLLCIGVCNAAKLPLPAEKMAALGAPGAPAGVVATVCATHPWNPGSFNFTSATTSEELASRAGKLLQSPCGCRS